MQIIFISVHRFMYRFVFYLPMNYTSNQLVMKIILKVLISLHISRHSSIKINTFVVKESKSKYKLRHFTTKYILR